MGTRVFLRTPEEADMKGFVAAARASSKLHASWVTAPSTPKKFREYLTRMTVSNNHAFLVCERESSGIAGVINVTNVILGNFRSAYLGYYAFSGYEGRGLMREGLQMLVRHAFGKMKLHRLEANIQPTNAASIALVRSCGFKLEGYSPRYLKINGRWRDHERWAIVAT